MAIVFGHLDFYFHGTIKAHKFPINTSENNVKKICEQMKTGVLFEIEIFHRDYFWFLY